MHNMLMINNLIINTNKDINEHNNIEYINEIKKYIDEQIKIIIGLSNKKIMDLINDFSSYLLNIVYYSNEARDDNKVFVHHEYDYEIGDDYSEDVGSDLITKMTHTLGWWHKRKIYDSDKKYDLEKYRELAYLGKYKLNKLNNIEIMNKEISKQKSNNNISIDKQNSNINNNNVIEDNILNDYRNYFFDDDIENYNFDSANEIDK